MPAGFNLDQPNGRAITPSVAPGRFARPQPAAAPAAPREVNTGAATAGAGAKAPAPPAEEARQRLPGVPNFNENPLGAIGFLLQEFSAGVAGRETGLQRAQREGQAASLAERQLAQGDRRIDNQSEGLRLQGIGLAFGFMERAAAMLKDAPAGAGGELSPEAKAIIQSIQKNVNIPGFDIGPMLEAAARGQLAGFEENIAAFKADPGMQVYLGTFDGWENMSPNQINSLMTKIREQRVEIAGAVDKAAGLREGERDDAVFAAELGIEAGVESQRRLAPGRLEEKRLFEQIEAQNRALTGGELEFNNLRARGFSENDARDIIANNLEVRGPGKEGEYFIINSTQGTARRVEGTGGGVPGAGAAAGAAPSAGGVSAEEAAESTGPVSMMAQALDATVGAVFNVQMFPETTANKRYLRRLGKTMQTLFINNDRFPVAEQNFVRGLTVDPDAFFRNPSAQMDNMVELRDWATAKLAFNDQEISGARLSADRRAEMIDQNSALRELLSFMGAPGGRPAGVSEAEDALMRKFLE